MPKISKMWIFDQRLQYTAVQHPKTGQNLLHSHFAFLGPQALLVSDFAAARPLGGFTVLTFSIECYMEGWRTQDNLCNKNQHCGSGTWTQCDLSYFDVGFSKMEFSYD